MNQQELEELELDVELWLREQTELFMEQWLNPDPQPYELEEENGGDSTRTT